MASVMEDMGYVRSFQVRAATYINLCSVHADEVDAVGHWEGNTRRETYAAKIPKSVSFLLCPDLGRSNSIPGCLCTYWVLCRRAVQCSMGSGRCPSRATDANFSLR